MNAIENLSRRSFLKGMVSTGALVSSNVQSGSYCQSSPVGSSEAGSASMGR